MGYHFIKIACVVVEVGKLLLLGSLTTFANGQSPVIKPELIQSVAPSRFIPIKLGKVQVGGEIGRRIEITIKNNLLKIDTEKDFLQGFRFREIEQPKYQTGPAGYVGLGKLILSAVSLGAYSRDAEVMAFKNRLIEETIGMQLSDGYIGQFVPKERMWVHWSGHEMVYLIQGLVSDYQHFNHRPSLEAACRLANYILNNWSSKPENITAWDIMWLGLDRAMLMIYAVTNDQRYLDFLDTNMDLRTWNPPVRSHVYHFQSHCLAQLDLYRFIAGEALLSQSKRVLDYLTAHHGLLITGSCSQQEIFHDNQDGSGHISETCATAYLIRLLHNMLQIEESSLYGDMMERAIYNALFAAQSPDGRKLRYFSPFEGKREYFDRDTYCCPCNFRRIIGELPMMVYYQGDGGVMVNLYTPSKASVTLRGDLTLDVRQETDYPNLGHVVLYLNPSRKAHFPLRLRIPRWCSESVTLTVNGQAVPGAIPAGRFHTLEREWKAGDRVELDLPMPWRVIKGRKSQAWSVAVMRGPVLFCLNLERNKLLKNKQVQLIHRLYIDPGTISDPIDDDSIRPDGQVCTVQAWQSWTPGNIASQRVDLKLILTEFADPGGEATYFRIQHPEGAMEDELIRNVAIR